MDEPRWGLVSSAPFLSLVAEVEDNFFRERGRPSLSFFLKLRTIQVELGLKTRELTTSGGSLATIWGRSASAEGGEVVEGGAGGIAWPLVLQGLVDGGTFEGQQFSEEGEVESVVSYKGSNEKPIGKVS